MNYSESCQKCNWQRINDPNCQRDATCSSVPDLHTWDASLQWMLASLCFASRALCPVCASSSSHTDPAGPWTPRNCCCRCGHPQNCLVSLWPQPEAPQRTLGTGWGQCSQWGEIGHDLPRTGLPCHCCLKWDASWSRSRVGLTKSASQRELF